MVKHAKVVQAKANALRIHAIVAIHHLTKATGKLVNDTRVGRVLSGDATDLAGHVSEEIIPL